MSNGTQRPVADDRTQFLVVGSQRSGTTVTYLTLRGHPEVCGFSDEIESLSLFERAARCFSRNEKPDAEQRRRYLPGLFAAIAFGEAEAGTRAGGMKTAVSCRREAELVAEALLGPLRHVALVITTRTDLVAQFGSDKRAHATGEWHSWHKKGERPADVRLTLDVNEFEAYVRRRREVDQVLGDLATARDALVVNFEDDIVGDPRRTASRVLTHVGVSDLEPVWLKSKKVAPPPEDFIVNVDELRERLRALV